MGKLSAAALFTLKTVPSAKAATAMLVFNLKGFSMMFSKKQTGLSPMALFMQVWGHVLWASFNLLFLMIFLFSVKPGRAGGEVGCKVSRHPDAWLPGLGKLAGRDDVLREARSACRMLQTYKWFARIRPNSLESDALARAGFRVR